MNKETEKLFDSFCLSGKITTVHAEQIMELLNIALKEIYKDGYNEGFNEGFNAGIREKGNLKLD